MGNNERVRIKWEEERLQRLAVDPVLVVELDRADTRCEEMVARLADGTYMLPCEHFSIVMNKTRRIALFTASNVDASPSRKRPEGRDATPVAAVSAGSERMTRRSGSSTHVSRTVSSFQTSSSRETKAPSTKAT